MVSKPSRTPHDRCLSCTCSPLGGDAKYVVLDGNSQKSAHRPCQRGNVSIKAVTVTLSRLTLARSMRALLGGLRPRHTTPVRETRPPRQEIHGGSSNRRYAMSWTTETGQDLTGAEVFGSDGDKVGTVSAVYPGYIVVEKGLFFPTDYYIPMSAVASYDTNQVSLTVSKDAALGRGWDVRPVDLETATIGTTSATTDTFTETDRL